MLVLLFMRVPVAISHAATVPGVRCVVSGHHVGRRATALLWHPVNSFPLLGRAVVHNDRLLEQRGWAGGPAVSVATQPVRTGFPEAWGMSTSLAAFCFPG